MNILYKRLDLKKNKMEESLSSEGEFSLSDNDDRHHIYNEESLNED